MLNKRTVKDCYEAVYDAIKDKEAGKKGEGADGCCAIF